jgi:single-strand DNA-binding protein
MSIVFTISGHLAADPELRHLPTGTAVANFTVISNERYRDRDTGAWTDGRRTDVRVSAWDTLAEHAAASLHSGSPVTVTGHRVEARAWTGQQDHTVHAGLELTADEIAVSLRRRTVTIHEPDRRTVPCGDGEVELDEAEVQAMLRGAGQRRTEPATVDDPDELRARLGEAAR